MTSIAQEQNTDDNLRLLIAQARLYSEAKRIVLFRIFVAALLAILAPIVAVVKPDAEVFMAVVGAIWTLITYLPFRGVQREKVRQAATIQEQFDTHLFNLSWNEALVISPVRPELIRAAARRSKENPARFRDWYSDTGSLPYPLDILACQRQNSVWDWRLQSHYAAGVVWIGAGVLAVDVVLGLVLHQYLSNFLLSLFIPTLPVFSQAVETAIAHWEIAKDKEDTAFYIEGIWQERLRHAELVSRERCRQIQDKLFILRRDGPLVPDIWYRWLRHHYQAEADSAVEELRKQVELAGLE